MRLEYISHSCFLIETGGLKIAFDPWITGSAYHGQWHLFPKSEDISQVEQADVILISHGHEDHLHHESLLRIQKDAHIFFPFQWRDGIQEYLRHLNFQYITEAVSFNTYTFGEIKITYLGYSLESVIVIESEGFVIVNINDALNSNHETAVNYLLEKIKSRWTKIDYLLSGWSGAGYFPNKVHYKTKDDIEVAKIREQYFADNFCRFTKYLQPEIAIAFAPRFVLLNDENRWINEIKFPRSNVNTYYKENFDPESEIKFPITYPGDYFIGKEFFPVSNYHLIDDMELYKKVDEIFSEEIVIANQKIIFSEFKMIELLDKLYFWINKNKTLYIDKVIEDAIFSIKLVDVEKNIFLNISSSKNDFIINRSNNSSKNDRLIITTKAELLLVNFGKMWGGDLMTIGYGIDVEVFEELSLEKNLDIVCVRLISRYPMIKDDLKNNKRRVLKYYFKNPSLTNLWITQKLRLRPYVNKYPFNERDHWITFNKCELCKVCKLPELDFATLEK